ncbi:MAG TPA: hypothetical protein VKA36_07480 [Solirubrobacterales bacterium]|nr:hypothetical protein [Solirubrobacterales bacterium]
MSEIAIFFYGLVVFSIVSAACWIIAWGIVQERRDRRQLDAGPGARAGEIGESTSTDAAGTTHGSREGEALR